MFDKLNSNFTVTSVPLRTRARRATGKFPCPVEGCPVAVSRKYDVDRHLDTHDPNTALNYCCQFPGCDYSARQRGNLKTHELNYHVELAAAIPKPRKRAHVVKKVVPLLLNDGAAVSKSAVGCTSILKIKKRMNDECAQLARAHKKQNPKAAIIHRKCARTPLVPSQGPPLYSPVHIQQQPHAMYTAPQMYEPTAAPSLQHTTQACQSCNSPETMHAEPENGVAGNLSLPSVGAPYVSPNEVRGNDTIEVDNHQPPFIMSLPSLPIELSVLATLPEFRRHKDPVQLLPGYGAAAGKLFQTVGGQQSEQYKADRAHSPAAQRLGFNFSNHSRSMARGSCAGTVSTGYQYHPGQVQSETFGAHQSSLFSGASPTSPLNRFNNVIASPTIDYFNSGRAFNNNAYFQPPATINPQLWLAGKYLSDGETTSHFVSGPHSSQGYYA